MTAGVVKLRYNPVTRASNHLEVDGVDPTSAVQRVTIDVDSGDVPTVEVDLCIVEVDVDLGVTQWRLTDRTREALEALGWMPPAEGDSSGTTS